MAVNYLMNSTNLRLSKGLFCAAFLFYADFKLGFCTTLMVFFCAGRLLFIYPKFGFGFPPDRLFEVDSGSDLRLQWVSGFKRRRYMAGMVLDLSSRKIPRRSPIGEVLKTFNQRWTISPGGGTSMYTRLSLPKFPARPLP